MSHLNLILRILVSFAMPTLVTGGGYLIVHNSVELGVAAIVGGIIILAIFVVQDRSERRSMSQSLNVKR
ncbi:hypothetical protein MUP77_04650 [Candidatus Bathyarchaeota archaeon]|nr:hypothetical protein [Candidatus Bathyarchaeota archaeon]